MGLFIIIVMNSKIITIVLVVAILIILAVIFWPKPSSAPESGLNGISENFEL